MHKIAVRSKWTGQWKASPPMQKRRRQLLRARDDHRGSDRHERPVSCDRQVSTFERSYAENARGGRSGAFIVLKHRFGQNELSQAASNGRFKNCFQILRVLCKHACDIEFCVAVVDEPGARGTKHPTCGPRLDQETSTSRTGGRPRARQVPSVRQRAHRAAPG